MLVERAAVSHRVRVLARRPEETRADLRRLGEDVHVVAGDLLDTHSMHELVRGGGGVVDAVISAAGPTRDGASSDFRRGADNLVQAMRGAGVARLVWMTGAGVRFPHDRPGVVDRAVVAAMHLLAGRALRDSRAAVDVVTGSGLDWTVVRAPRLVDRAESGTAVVVPGVGPESGMQASRAALARVLLEAVEEARWRGEAPVVGE